MDPVFLLIEDVYHADRLLFELFLFLTEHHFHLAMLLLHLFVEFRLRLYKVVDFFLGLAHLIMLLQLGLHLVVVGLHLGILDPCQNVPILDVKKLFLELGITG